MGFCFDVETLDKESTAVILSASIVYFDPKDKPTYQQLLDNTLFVKFDATDQIKRLKRSSSKLTLEWWDKQPDYVKNISLKPKPNDLLAEDGLRMIESYMNRYPNPKQQTIWMRGTLDQLVIDSLSYNVGFEPISPFAMWRDVRTAVDIIYGSHNGYTEIVHPEFNRDLVIKHHPAHDVCLDIMMLLYGKEKE
jgi:hypothetical protein